MIEVTKIETAGWEPAIRGMRNPLNSWDKIDSAVDAFVKEEQLNDKVANVLSTETHIGPNDESLMRRLISLGSNDHCKFRRMLTICCDVDAPIYWWKEFDTYKVGTVANSCSTMHTLMQKPFSIEQFSTDQLYPASIPVIMSTIDFLNSNRALYLDAKESGRDHDAKCFWYEIVQLLPSSWMQKRTVMLNYEVMANIYRARKNHKLKEWHDFIDAIVASVPYPWIFTGDGC